MSELLLCYPYKLSVMAEGIWEEWGSGKGRKYGAAQ